MTTSLKSHLARDRPTLTADKAPDYGHLPPRFVPRVVRAEWAWIPTSRAAAAGALVVC